MAQSTIDADIIRLQLELDNLRIKIGKQEALDELEEGGAGSKFRTQFADIDKLYRREGRLQTRLDALYRTRT